LPDAETGTTGRARVSNEYGAVDLALPGDATQTTPDSRPGAVQRLSDADISAQFDEAFAALPPAPRQFTLRFRFESDELTPDSQALVAEILKTAKAYSVPEVVVVGHTDTMGDARANVALGLKRANSVRSLLVAAGIDPTIIEVSSHGETDPLVKTPDNRAEPRNRRVGIVVR
jgi:outer membrane protein OmpA-like peptidoglycan-associated protein